MKKKLLVTICFLSGIFILNAQTKQSALATQQNDLSFIQTQSAAFSIVQPNLTTQAISGYYQEGFEGTLFPPAGWRVQNVAGPTYTWARSTAQAHLSTASAFIRYDNVAGGGQDWLITPKYIVTATTDSVTFWMRLAFQGFAPDSLAIKVSTTDSLTASFTKTILLLREGVNYPPNATTWYRFKASLSAYVGQPIFIAFKHYNSDGDGLYIDNVKIGTQPANDITATSIISPPAGMGQGPVIPQATFVNTGSATQGLFNVKITSTPGGYTSSSSINSLAPGATATATFGVWNPAPGTYTVKVFSELPTDENLTNDTLTKIVTVFTEFNHYGWSSKPVLPAGRWATGPVFDKSCIASTDTGYVYLISGADAAFANTTLNTRYNTKTGTYMNMAPIPVSRTQISPVRLKGKIYVIGGYTGSFAPVTTNSIYDIATNTWSTGAAIPTAVGDYGVGTYGDSLIYIVSGYTGSVDVNLVQIYNVNTNTWSAGTPKSGNAVGGGRMGITGNNIIFMGGYSQTLASTRSEAVQGVINPANPTTITWTSIPSFPGGTTGRHGAGVAFENNGLVYFAGGDPNGQGTSATNSVYAYNTLLNQWEHGPNMIPGVSNITNLAGIVHNDSLFLVAMGGYDGAVVLTKNAWLNLGLAAPLPSLQGDVAICSGNSTTLTASNALTYSWSPSSDLSNTSMANPVANPTTTSTFSVTMTKAYGCPIQAMVTVTVNSLPTVTASATSSVICSGDATTLNAGGAVTYTWTGGVTDNVAFNPTNTDTYTVTGTDANGCMNTAVQSVTVNSLPTVTASATSSVICSGDATTLNAGGAVTYTWTGGVTDNVAFNPTSTDTYTVTGTDANGCQGMTTQLVTVNNLPPVMAMTNNTLLCVGETATLSAMGATSYTWSTTETTTDIAVSPTVQTTYTLMGMDGNGCSNTSTVMQDVSLCTGVEAVLNSNSMISIYPNPSNGEFAISLFAFTENTTISIYNALGALVLNEKVSASLVNVRITEMANGIYNVIIKENNSVTAQKKLIKH